MSSYRKEIHLSKIISELKYMVPPAARCSNFGEQTTRPLSIAPSFVLTHLGLMFKALNAWFLIINPFLNPVLADCATEFSVKDGHPNKRIGEIKGSGREGEIGFVGLPLLRRRLHQKSRDQPQAGGVAGKDPHDAGPPFDLLIEPFQPVGHPQEPPMRRREVQHGEPFGQVLLHPCGQFGSGSRITLNGLLQQSLGLVPVRGGEDGADRFGDLLLHRLLGNVTLSIALQVTLAALPGDAPEDRDPGRPKARMFVTGHQLHAGQPPLGQQEKHTPIGFRITITL
jgi:hypothetical protein